MPISSQVPIIGYVANGVTKSFAFPFAILSADDLKVKVGADVVTTGFSIAGVGDRDGGSVTFTDAPASLTPIILYREVTLDRTTDYQENGDLLAIVLDDDLDRIWMALQDQLLLADRAVRAPIGETLQQLPPASERALMALAFDAAGNPIVVRGTNDGGAALALDLLDKAPGKGAALVGADDGAGGSLWTTVAGFITFLRSSVGASIIGFIQDGIGAVKRSMQDKQRDVVSVFDFMTQEQIADVKARTYAIDVSDAVITAVIASQWANKKLLAPAGAYKITKEVAPNNALPLNIEGEGCGAFSDLGVLNEVGTVFALFTPGINLFKLRTNQQVRDSMRKFACINKSGTKIGAVAIDGQGATFCDFADLTLADFEYGYMGQKNIYLSFDRIVSRGCDYPIWALNVTGVPPLTLNTTFFNNVISLRDCSSVNCKIGYALAGAGISLKNCDVGLFSEAGVSIGGDDYNVSTFDIGHLYAEDGAGIPLRVTNAFGSVGALFVGKASTLAIKAKNSRLIVDQVYAYAPVTKMLDNDNSRVWITHYNGAFASTYTNTNGGKTYLQQLMQPVESSTQFSLSAGQSVVIPGAVPGNYMTELTMRLSDNGTTKIQKWILRTNSARVIATGDTPSVNLTVTSALNGSTGRYDVTFANTSGSPWSIDVTHYAFINLNLVA